MLESLSPVERAVFLLRDVFGFGYDEIAQIVEKSEDNCRQLASRARRRVDERRPRFESSRRFAKQARRLGLSVRPAEVNGQPGAAVVGADDQIVHVVGLDIADGAVQAVRSIVNPDKLRHLRRKPWNAASIGSSPTSRQSPPARS